MKWGSFLLILMVNFGASAYASTLPKGFVYLKDIDPTIIQEIKYNTSDNFIGRPILGYQADQCILTKKAAETLAKIQRRLVRQSFSLKVYDCYRPQMAVNDFMSWSKDAADQKMKDSFYPHVNKADFFKLGYVAMKSSHTRGSTVDLTIVRLVGDDGQVTDMAMGTHFDYMDKTSHPLANGLSKEARRDQLFLRNVMYQFGFVPLDTEWWHFTLKKEPFPNTYFNFPVA